MALLMKSLDAATTTGPGLAMFMDVPKTFGSVQTSYSGTLGDTVVSLEYTIDGTNWYSITGSRFVNPPNGSVLGGAFPPFIGLRANIPYMADATAITAWIAAA